MQCPSRSIAADFVCSRLPGAFRFGQTPAAMPLRLHSEKHFFFLPQSPRRPSVRGQARSILHRYASLKNSSLCRCILPAVLSAASQFVFPLFSSRSAPVSRSGLPAVFRPESPYSTRHASPLGWRLYLCPGGTPHRDCRICSPTASLCRSLPARSVPPAASPLPDTAFPPQA